MTIPSPAQTGKILPAVIVPCLRRQFRTMHPHRPTTSECTESTRPPMPELMVQIGFKYAAMTWVVAIAVEAQSWGFNAWTAIIAKNLFEPCQVDAMARARLAADRRRSRVWCGWRRPRRGSVRSAGRSVLDVGLARNSRIHKLFQQSHSTRRWAISISVSAWHGWSSGHQQANTRPASSRRMASIISGSLRTSCRCRAMASSRPYSEIL